MSDVTVHHNPSCSRSRGALEILSDRGVNFDVVQYLDDPPSRADLERVLDLLDEAPRDLVRRDKRFEELGLCAGDYTSRDEVVDLLLRHPALMQRPVVVRRGRAVIARPSERVLELFD
jgi:arsenate reductase (glutaredoxin)